MSMLFFCFIKNNWLTFSIIQYIRLNEQMGGLIRKLLYGRVKKDTQRTHKKENYMSKKDLTVVPPRKPKAHLTIDMASYGLPGVTVDTKNIDRAYEFQNRNTHLWHVRIPFIAGGSIITSPFQNREAATDARNAFNGHKTK